jgi:hypothetical protein
LSVGLGCSADAFGVRSRLEAECLREFRRIEDVVEFVLVEHLVQFTDSRIKPSRQPEHGPREDSILRLRAELLGDEFNELLSGRRISGFRLTSRIASLRGVSSLTSSLPIAPPAPRMVNMVPLLARLILVRL